MARLFVEDISFDDVNDSIYDLAIFVCGYEQRSTYLYSVIDERQIKDSCIFVFQGNKDSDVAQKNLKFFTKRDAKRCISVENSDVLKFVHAIKKNISDKSSAGVREVSILVDYSSMPRLWFSEILSLVKNLVDDVTIVVDFVYSVGEHAQLDTPRQLGEPIVLPGCEAITTFAKNTVAVIGLGFDSGAPICIHGKLEPDLTFALIARPGALEDYAKRAYSINSDFIENSVSEVVYSPLSSVKQTYDSLREIFYPFRGSATTVLVPFGPKPHALASMVAAMNYPAVTCIYASTGSIASPVTATTELVMSRITRLSA